MACWSSGMVFSNASKPLSVPAAPRIAAEKRETVTRSGTLGSDMPAILSPCPRPLLPRLRTRPRLVDTLAMPIVAFTPNLRRHLDCPEVEVPAGTVAEALEQIFERNPRLRSYVLDEQGRLRKHVAVFVGGELIADRLNLSDRVDVGKDVFVMQALSGG